MMRIGKVRMRMSERVMAVRVRMASAGRNGIGVVMLVMRVVLMFMLVLDRIMGVVVRMTFGQVQPHSPRHQRAGE